MNRKYINLSNILTILAVGIGALWTVTASSWGRALSILWILTAAALNILTILGDMSREEDSGKRLRYAFLAYPRYLLRLAAMVIAWIGLQMAFVGGTPVADCFGDGLVGQIAKVAANCLGLAGIWKFTCWNELLSGMKYITLVTLVLPFLFLLILNISKKAEALCGTLRDRCFVFGTPTVKYGWLYTLIICGIAWNLGLKEATKDRSVFVQASFLILILIAVFLICYELKLVIKAQEATGRVPAAMQAFLAVGFLYLLCIFSSEMGYLTTDDGDIQMGLSGAMTGTPFPYHTYIHPLLAAFVAGLYRFLPGLQWWYVYSQSMMILGIYLIHYSILKISEQKALKPLPVWGGLLAIDACVILYPVMNVGFTLVPAVLLTGVAIYLVYLAGEEKLSLNRIWWTLLPIFAAALHRVKAAEVSACYVGVAVIYLFLTRQEETRKKLRLLIPYALGVIVLVLGVSLSGQLIRAQVETQESIEYEHERAQFTDYPVDTYEENPELYESVGWDEGIYYLASHWCFMLDEVDTEAFKTIEENSTRTEVLQDKLDRYLLSLPETWAMALAYGAAFIFSAFVVLRKGNRKNVLMWLLTNLGTFAIFGIQLIIQRILYRTIYIEVLPCIVLNFAWILQTENRLKWRKNLLYVLSALWVILGCVPIFNADFSQERRDYMTENANFEKELYDYAIANPDNIYILSKLAIHHSSPANVYTDEQPSNILCDGDSNYRTAVYHTQWDQYGIDELTCEVFKEDNVYFIITSNIQLNHEVAEVSTFNYFYQYLKEHYGAIGFVKEEKICGEDTYAAYVYHFVFEENKNQYNEYWDIIDGYVRAIYPNFTLEAHRGYCQKYPENTTLAFTKAAKIATYDAIETDAQETADGVLVCVHDLTIDDFTDGSGAVSDYTYEELMQLHVDGGNGWDDSYSGQLTIATISDYLDICIEYGKTPYIELKCLSESGIDSLLAMLEDKGLEGQCVLTSNTYEYLQYVYSKTQAYTLEYMTSRKTEEALSDILDRVETIPGMIYRPHETRIDEEMVAACKERGITLECWGLSVKKPDRLAELMNYGVTGGTCNGYIFKED